MIFFSSKIYFCQKSRAFFYTLLGVVDLSLIDFFRSKEFRYKRRNVSVFIMDLCAIVSSGIEIFCIL